MYNTDNKEEMKELNDAVDEDFYPVKISGDTLNEILIIADIE